MAAALAVAVSQVVVIWFCDFERKSLYLLHFYKCLKWFKTGLIVMGREAASLGPPGAASGCTGAAACLGRLVPATAGGDGCSGGAPEAAIEWAPLVEMLG